MTDVNTAGQPGAAQDPNPEAAKTNNYATVEQLAEMSRKFDGMSAALRKVSEAVTAAPRQQTQHDATAPETASAPKKSKADLELEAKFATLEEKVKALNEEKEKLKMRTFNTLTREACLSKRVADTALDPLVNHMRSTLGERMVLDEEGNQIMVKPPAGQEDFEASKPFSDVLSEYLAGPGAWALPASKLPSGSGMQAQRSFIGADGSHKFSKLSAAQIHKHPDKVAFADYIANHKDEWLAKVRDASPS